MLNFINKRRSRKGFTLIELVVVVAILGILAAIAIPRFTGIQATAKENSDKATYSAINSAIAVAVAEGKITTATFDVSAAATTGVITTPYLGTEESPEYILEVGAKFQLTDNMDKKFTWNIVNGEITAPVISDGGLITGVALSGL